MMLARWKSWAKDPPVPWSKVITIAMLVMAELLLSAMTPLRGISKERSLLYFWARLLVREVHVIFMPNH